MGDHKRHAVVVCELVPREKAIDRAEQTPGFFVTLEKVTFGFALPRVLSLDTSFAQSKTRRDHLCGVVRRSEADYPSVLRVHLDSAAG